MAGLVWNEQATLGDPGSYIPYTKLPAVTGAAIAACDALDGIVDGVIEDPGSVSSIRRHSYAPGPSRTVASRRPS